MVAQATDGDPVAGFQPGGDARAVAEHHRLACNIQSERTCGAVHTQDGPGHFMAHGNADRPQAIAGPAGIDRREFAQFQRGGFFRHAILGDGHGGVNADFQPVEADAGEAGNGADNPGAAHATVGRNNW